jgi:aspartate aminotransferase/aminotransferase
MFNSPSNPTGVVATDQVCKDVVALADEHNLLIVSDEIYDEFCYEKTQQPGRQLRCPSPATTSDRLILLRGFSKTYGMTGWRLGYAAGPRTIINEMTKLQQYTFVCAPSMVQLAGVEALEVDMSEHVDAYRHKRDRVVERLANAFELTTPGGAFYAFPKVPDRLGVTGTQFVERAVERGVLIIPGNVFSRRDTHFRLSYACDDETLGKGLDVLVELGGSG